jgi:hypothetical protein
MMSNIFIIINMDRTIVLDDPHGSSFWKYVINNEKCNRLLFLGDYWDSLYIPFTDQANNFRDIVEFKKNGGIETILLIGNHDHHYFPDIGDTGTSGYQRDNAPTIGSLLEENRELFQMAYAMDNFLFTHAGVGSGWIDMIKEAMDEMRDHKLNTAQDYADFVNKVWKLAPKQFIFNGWHPAGDNVGQTPIWIRPDSLIQDSKKLQKQGIKQVVGHTQMRRIDIVHTPAKGEFYFTNTNDKVYNKQFLIIEDGEAYVKEII